MKKLIKDYTLDEVKEYCNNTDPDKCEKCIFHIFCEDLAKGGITPEDWQLNEPSRWTDGEIAKANAILILWPNIRTIKRCVDCVIGIQDDGQEILTMEGDMFPSLKVNEAVNLRNIIASGAVTFNG